MTQTTSIPGLEKAFYAVARAFPWARDILYRATFVSSVLCPTMCVDKRLRIAINPEFFGKLPPGQRQGLLAHMIFHSMFNHYGRFEVFDDDVNIAVDCEVNAALRKCKQELPKDACFPENFGCDDSMTAEEILDRLRRHKHLHSMAICESAGDTPSNDIEGADTGQYDVHGHGPWSEDLEKAPGVDPVHAEATRRKVLERLLEQKESGQLQGDIPEGILREAMRLQTRIPWTTILAGGIRGATGRNSNGWCVRKQHPSIGGRLALPTLNRVRSTNVVVIGDTSGSMSENMLGRVVDVVMRAAEHATGWFIPCDAAAYEPQRLVRGRKPILKGGGGTDFRSAFASAAELKPSAIVIVTDTYGDWPDKPPSCPVWCVATRRDIYGQVPSWVRILQTCLLETTG